MSLDERIFLEEELIRLQDKAKPFQTECDESLCNKDNILLSMPTGSGKTDRFLIWAIRNLLDSYNNHGKIIITAPIKALSNQRFRELYLKGYNVGVETGDIQHNIQDCTILCCTQEIATYKYLSEDNIVIIDEFHYIYSDPARSRTYIEFLIKSRARNIFICSATLGELEKIKEYVDRVSKRDFYMYSSNERLTDIIYKDEIKLDQIVNAYVLSFSHKDCKRNATILRKSRKENGMTVTPEEEEIILKTATKYEITNNELILNALSKIGYYYGSMLPKERLFVTELFEQKILDTVFSTDAIALGVNFPIENIVLSTLKKSNKVISKNLFDQVIGRAGRYGLFTTGYVYYCKEFETDSDLADEYHELINKENENITIKLTPSISKILNGERTIEEEVIFVERNSTEKINTRQVLNKVLDDIELILNFDIEESLYQQKLYGVMAPRKYQPIDWSDTNNPALIGLKEKYGNYNEQYQELFEREIIRLYNDEFSPIQNCILVRDAILGRKLEKILFDFFGCGKKGYKRQFRMLLQVRKYLNNLPDEYKANIDLVKLDTIISEIDISVFDIEISFQEYSQYDEYSSVILTNMLNRETNGEFTVEEVKEQVKQAKQVKKEQPKKQPKKKIIKEEKKEEPKVEVVEKKEQPKKKKANKQPQPRKRVGMEGKIVKEAGAPFGAPKYLVLLYVGGNQREAILLNYTAYPHGIINLKLETDMKKYFELGETTLEEHKDALNACISNANTFYVSEGSDRKQIKKIVNNLKQRY